MAERTQAEMLAMLAEQDPVERLNQQLPTDLGPMQMAVPVEEGVLDQVQRAVAEQLGGGREDYRRAEKLLTAAEFLPGLGDLSDAAAVSEAADKGDLVGVGIAGLGLLPGVGGVLRRGGEELRSKGRQVLYHATDKDFTEFKKMPFSESKQYGRGTYLTPSKDVANIAAMDLTYSQPKELRGSYQPPVVEGARVIPVTIGDLKLAGKKDYNLALAQAQARVGMKGLGGRERSAKVREVADDILELEKGFDGKMLGRPGGTPEIIVYDPKNIRSAFDVNESPAEQLAQTTKKPEPPTLQVDLQFKKDKLQQQEGIYANRQAQLSENIRSNPKRNQVIQERNVAGQRAATLRHEINVEEAEPNLPDTIITRAPDGSILPQKEFTEANEYAFHGTRGADERIIAEGGVHMKTNEPAFFMVDSPAASMTYGAKGPGDLGTVIPARIDTRGFANVDFRGAAYGDFEDDGVVDVVFPTDTTFFGQRGQRFELSVYDDVVSLKVDGSDTLDVSEELLEQYHPDGLAMISDEMLINAIKDSGVPGARLEAIRDLDPTGARMLRGTTKLKLPEQQEILTVFDKSRQRLAKGNPSSPDDFMTISRAGDPLGNFQKGGEVNQMRKPVISSGLSGLLRGYTQGPLASVPRGTQEPVGMRRGGGMGGFEPNIDFSNLPFDPRALPSYTVPAQAAEQLAAQTVPQQRPSDFTGTYNAAVGRFGTAPNQTPFEPGMLLYEGTDVLQSPIAPTPAPVAAPVAAPMATPPQTTVDYTNIDPVIPNIPAGMTVVPNVSAGMTAGGSGQSGYGGYTGGSTGSTLIENYQNTTPVATTPVEAVEVAADPVATTPVATTPVATTPVAAAPVETTTAAVAEAPVAAPVATVPADPVYLPPAEVAPVVAGPSAAEILAAEQAAADLLAAQEAEQIRIAEEAAAAQAAEQEAIRVANEQAAADLLAQQEAARIAQEQAAAEESQRLASELLAAQQAEEALIAEQLAAEQLAAEQLAAQQAAQLVADQEAASQLQAAEQLAAQQEADRIAMEAQIAATPDPDPIYEAPTQGELLQAAETAQAAEEELFTTPTDTGTVIDRGAYGQVPAQQQPASLGLSGIQSLLNRVNLDVGDTISDYTTGYPTSQGMEIKRTYMPFEGTEEERATGYVMPVYKPVAQQSMPSLFGTRATYDPNAVTDPAVLQEAMSAGSGAPSSNSGLINVGSQSSAPGTFGLPDSQMYECGSGYVLQFVNGKPTCVRTGGGGPGKPETKDPSVIDITDPSQGGSMRYGGEVGLQRGIGSFGA